MASRTDGTRTCVTGRSRRRSTTRAAAPRRTAFGANSCPSTLVPGTQKKSEPGPASSERYVTAVTAAAGSPSMVRSFRPWTRSATGFGSRDA